MRNFNRLVEQLNRCADNGITCDACSVRRACIRRWDIMCDNKKITRGQFVKLVQNFSELRSKKNGLVA